MNVSNRLEHAAALDRHTDSIGRSKANIAKNKGLAHLWNSAANEVEPNEVDMLRLDNLWIDLINIQRSNYQRAKTVGDDGLARLTALNIAVELSRSNFQLAQWEATRAWHALASTNFVDAVEAELKEVDKDRFRPGAHSK
jgi:hypothetical protein